VSLSSLILFLDFDGTISRCDVVDVILEAYADRAWLDVERQWQGGTIGSRDCLRAQIGLVRASREQMNALLDRVEVDAGFLPLLETCARHRIPVHIVSDGFDYCIARILERCGPDVNRLLRGAKICASHLESLSGDRWIADFPFADSLCEHGCATCKPRAMQRLNPARASSFFVGDGLSDRYAARSADVVFAKASLAAFCAEQGVPHNRFDTLAQVATQLDDPLRVVPVAAPPHTTSLRKVWAPK
jgi:2,3-diketo-5-methylthio-1-phosphopentane phosphatase